ncbi:putative multi-domain containing protein [Aduncisulcus paluster]|uniref:Proteasome subunit beta n=1 Tax=Aduncisulcus paluster TaxID=2918883 RepID=A0ABQ5K583_9EUKA|nr:putative multi-domain containing protein [Aduncisulcus paluster]
MAEPVKLGTTIMSVKYAGGVILGADTRTSAGSYVANRVSYKISKLSDRIYCCRSGSAADTRFLADVTKTNLSMHSSIIEEPPLVRTAARLMRHYTYAYREHLSAGLIVAGVDEIEGPKVFQLPSGGSAIEIPVAIGGSGSTFITAFVDANYRPDMNKAEALQFVIRAISHAMDRDGSSGGIIRTVVIPESEDEEVAEEWHKTVL